MSLGLRDWLQGLELLGWGVQGPLVLEVWLIGDAHERMKEIPTGPTCYLAKKKTKTTSQDNELSRTSGNPC